MSLKKIEARVDNWLRSSEKNAAGNLGLYRIVYAIFYLGMIASIRPADILHIPLAFWQPVPTTLWLQAPPSAAILSGLEWVLVAALILLIFGYQTRIATATVAVVGIALISVQSSYGKIEHAPTFLTLYIPMVMAFSRWGETHSIDAALRARRGLPTTDPHTANVYYGWVFKLLLLILAIQFTTGGLIKMFIPGNWLQEWEVLRKLLIGHHLFNPNPPRITLWIINTPLLYVLFQAGALTFETLFFLALKNRMWRTLFVSMAVIFHALNELFLGFNFYYLHIIYLLFLVDWQGVYDWMQAKVSLPMTISLSSRVLIVGTITIMIGGLVLWGEPGSILRSVLTSPLLRNTMLWIARIAAGVGLLQTGWLLYAQIIPRRNVAERFRDVDSRNL
jgi:hypothetical protein